ncbi:hypothetical protein NDU88_003052, partial [Pleurodeles waltl]
GPIQVTGTLMYHASKARARSQLYCTDGRIGLPGSTCMEKEKKSTVLPGSTCMEKEKKSTDNATWPGVTKHCMVANKSVVELKSKTLER